MVIIFSKTMHIVDLVHVITATFPKMSSLIVNPHTISVKKILTFNLCQIMILLSNVMVMLYSQIGGVNMMKQMIVFFMLYVNHHLISSPSINFQSHDFLENLDGRIKTFNT